jgi:hypothetical protein
LTLKRTRRAIRFGPDRRSHAVILARGRSTQRDSAVNKNCSIDE